jgi:hypothetical protein
MASVSENKPVQPIANPSLIESQNRTLWLIIVSTGVTFIAFIFIRSIHVLLWDQIMVYCSK